MAMYYHIAGRRDSCQGCNKARRSASTGGGTARRTGRANIASYYPGTGMRRTKGRQQRRSSVQDAAGEDAPLLPGADAGAALTPTRCRHEIRGIPPAHSALSAIFPLIPGVRACAGPGCSLPTHGHPTTGEREAEHGGEEARPRPPERGWAEPEAALLTPSAPGLSL